jgi:Flp pilus assembly protein TadD
VDTSGVGPFDVFLSYARTDRERVLVLREALEAQGLEVWLDETEVETFESIRGGIENGLAFSRALVAFYSQEYPARRACQWELTAAFLAAQRAGVNPRQRMLVVNPEQGPDHIQPVELRDALYADPPSLGDPAGHRALAEQIAKHVRNLEGMLGDLGVSVRPSWWGRRPVSASRFVGRMSDVWKVHSALVAGEVGLITGASGDPAVKVVGMGGIGKSLLAQEYALRFGGAYPGGVFWLHAHGHDDTSETFTPETGNAEREAEREAQLLDFARQLGINVSGLTPEQLSGALARFLDEQAESFLWIVDDLPGGLQDDAGVLDRWLAPGRYGRSLLTTRSHAYEALGMQIDLGVLTAEEGLELLAKHRVPDGPGEEEQARGLVVDLGGHALALDVAGGALRAEKGVRSYADYRTALANPDRDELEFAAKLVGELPGGHETSIAVTLRRSIQGLDDRGLDFLRLASVLAPEPIPANLVVEVFALMEEAEAHDRAVKGMHEAHVASLAETMDDGARQVHTLVSRTIRHLHSSPERTTKIAHTATTVLTRQLVALYTGRVSADGATLAHARQLAGIPRDEHQARLLSTIAAHDYLRGDYPSARYAQEQGLDVLRKALGPEHPDTLGSTSNLAETLREQGDLAGARTLHTHALDARLRVLGPEHPDTLGSMNNLALTLAAQGDLAGARTLHTHALDARLRVLGPEHPDTLGSMNNLAATLREQGDLAGARTLQEPARDVSQQVLGPEHPDTLTLTSNLAETLRLLGDLAGARTLNQQALDARLRVLGPEHPDTLGSMNNLAETLRLLGDLAGARTLFQQTLDALPRVLGPEHPNTLGTMSNLAETLVALGDLAGARTLHQQALDGRLRVLGPEHPDTLSSMNNLALTLDEQSDFAGARALQEQAMNICLRVLGPEHPFTLTLMSNLALTLEAQGDLAGARALQAQVRDGLQRALGPEHQTR